MLQLSLRYGEASQGTFDVTLGPAVEFWRDENPLVPDPAKFTAVRRRIGQAHGGSPRRATVNGVGRG